MKRYDDFEKLSNAVRGGLPGVATQWLAAARRPLETLTRAALDPEISDTEFRDLVEAFSKRLPELLAELDHAALEEHLAGAMGAAMANGLTARLQTEDGKTEERQAKDPGDPAAVMAGRGAGRGKRCGNSWIAAWKQCGPDDGREWDPATAGEAAVLARLSGRKFKQGARILATPESLRHAAKGHGHQLGEKDWQQLRGRLFDPRTERRLSKTKAGDPAVEFRFSRGNDLMEAVFTVHFPFHKSPGELRIKTYARRN